MHVKLYPTDENRTDTELTQNTLCNESYMKFNRDRPQTQIRNLNNRITKLRHNQNQKSSTAVPTAQIYIQCSPDAPPV